MTGTQPSATRPGWLERTLARLDPDAIAATAAELIAIPSVSDTAAEAACLDQVADWLTGHDIPVDSWSVLATELPAPAGWSAETARSQVPALTATAGAPTGPGLLVNVHLDVVPAAEQPGWGQDPFAPRVAAGWLTGRGAADTKGGLAAALHVLAALTAEIRSGTADGPPGRLVLTPVVGEEDGGAGTLATLARALPVQAAVVVEPTGLQLAHATAGALRFRVRVPGRTAHGSVRHQGVSAIEKTWLVHEALLALERTRGARWPLCIGRIEGGTQAWDVPGLVTLDGRYGVAPQEDPDTARSALERAVAEVAAGDDWLSSHPPVVEWVGAQWLPAATPRQDPLVAAFASVCAGEPVEMPYGSDAGLLRHVAGLPVVILGPGDVADAHAADERVSVADLGRFAEVLLRGAAQWWAAVLP